MTTRQAASLRPGQFKYLIRVASVTGRMNERDVLLLWLTHSTGMRVTELACWRPQACFIPAESSSPRCIYVQKSRRAAGREMFTWRMLDALPPWRLGLRFDCVSAEASPARMITRACALGQNWL